MCVFKKLRIDLESLEMWDGHVVWLQDSLTDKQIVVLFPINLNLRADNADFEIYGCCKLNS